MRVILAKVRRRLSSRKRPRQPKPISSPGLFATFARITRGERGASLVEILAAVAVISLSLVVLIASLSTGALAVRTSNRLTRAANLAAVQLESIKAADYVTGTVSYPTIPTGAYTIDQEISYWGGSSFASAPGADSGMQWITVTVSYDGEALAVVSNYKVNR